MPDADVAVGDTFAECKVRRKPVQAVDDCLGKPGTAAARDLLPEAVHPGRAPARQAGFD